MQEREEEGVKDERGGGERMRKKGKKKRVARE